jgi:hypothetical protein
MPPRAVSITIGKKYSAGGERSHMLADDVHMFANWFLLGSLVVGVISTYAIVVSSNIRDTESRRKLEVMRAESAVAIQKTEELKQQNLELQYLVERERLARVKIEEKLAPRSLSEEQQQRLIAKWKLFAGQKVEVFVAYDEEEVLNTGKLIERMLRSAGWSVKSERELEITIGPERKGIVLYVSGKVPARARIAAQTWVESLADERFVVSGPETVSDLPPQTFRVAIGRK